jgi:hypothetical protein
MPKPLLEEGLLEPIVRHLHRRRFRSLLTEVPFYDYRIDVFAFSARDDVTVAVELKLKKWRRAFEQALVYQLCADLCFVAMPNLAAQSVEQEMLAEMGIGLISVSNAGRCRMVLPAIPSSVIRPHYRSELLDMLTKFS